MDNNSAWMLVAIAVIVVAFVLPQVLKSRSLLGQSRSEDRFSQDLRVVSNESPAETHPAHEIGSLPLHLRNSGDRMNRPLTRSVRLSYDIREYTKARAERAAAISRRSAAAKRRAALAAVAAGGLVVCAILMSTSICGPEWLALPAGLLALDLAVGVFAARRGAQEDAAFLERINEIQGRLERTPGGRRALATYQHRPQAHSIPIPTSAPPAASPAAAADSSTPVCTGESSCNIASEIQEASVETVAEVSPEVAEEPEPQEKPKWTPTPLPPPSYTLKARVAYAHAPAPEEADTDSQATTPYRPQKATPLPAGAALSAEELVVMPVDLEVILQRRRATGS